MTPVEDAARRRILAEICDKFSDEEILIMINDQISKKRSIGEINFNAILEYCEENRPFLKEKIKVIRLMK
jgi:hypothetical protein